MLNTIENKKLNFIQLEKFKSFAARIVRFGFDFYLFNSDGHLEFEKTASANPKDSDLLREFAVSNLAEQSDGIVQLGETGELLGLNICIDELPVATVILDTHCLEGKEDEKFGSEARGNIELVKELLFSLNENLILTNKSSVQLEMMSGELAQTYEELVLLYKMSTSMKFTQSDANYLQIACDNVTELVQVEGIAILLEKEIEGMKQFVVTAGSGIIKIDTQMTDVLELAMLEELGRGKDAIIDSNLDSPLKYNWPESVRSIIAVPLKGKEKISGIMVAVNRIDKPDFDSIDAKLFNTVAHECAVFIENGRLFKDLKDLFIGSLKALTNSIDAKDQYTRGHSERVAFVSKWIAEKMVETGNANLGEDEIHQIYLAGLLHDIGKIGIDEKVLKKNGKLEDDEWYQIRSHPSIGASILNDIKQMKAIIPGVLCHHERVDGKGYPQGLKGDSLPLVAKIVNVADAFDAMVSKRVYREALGISRAINEIQKGLGTQFDPLVGKVFVESDLKQLWDIIQDGIGGSWDCSSFTDYGSEAVGTLLR